MWGWCRWTGASLEVRLADMGTAFEVVRPGLSQIDLSQGRLPGRPRIVVLGRNG